MIFNKYAIIFKINQLLIKKEKNYPDITYRDTHIESLHGICASVSNLIDGILVPGESVKNDDDDDTRSSNNDSGPDFLLNTL